jgi:hypothetical protein
MDEEKNDRDKRNHFKRSWARDPEVNWEEWITNQND